MEKYSNEFLYENELKWETAGEGVTRQIMGYNQDIMMVKVKFEKGAIGYVHKHVHTQTSYVAAGKFELVIEDQTTTIQTGDGFFVPSNKAHGVKCLEAGILVDVFNPHREDFLK